MPVPMGVISNVRAMIALSLTILTHVLDTEDQKKEFVRDPIAFDKYVRGLEGELNKRFTMVGQTQLEKSRDYGG
jgi:hypothetical protein